MENQEYKRHVAFKMRIGDLLAGRMILDADKFRFLELNDKQILRTNIIANVVDKFIQDGEKKFGSITIDDASGQVKIKVFGEDIEKFSELNQGDTIQVIGLLRSWNNELYLLPEIIKKKQPEYLLLRKLELDLERPKPLDKGELSALREQILTIVKKEEANGGVDIEKLIIDLKSSPDAINQEVRKLLEEGIAYEPRPGKLRYLG